jgi:hypothetical protein
MIFNRLSRRWISNCSLVAICFWVVAGLGSASQANALTPKAEQAIMDCYVVVVDPGFKSCNYQPALAKPNYRVALIGDSHLRGLYPAVIQLAKKFNWSLTTVSKSACPWVSSKLFPTGLERGYCKDWNASAEAFLAGTRHFDLIINSQSSFVTHSFDNIGKGFAAAVKSQIKRGTWVVVIRDVPKGIMDSQLCLSDAARLASGGCDNSRLEALSVVDPMPAAVKGWPQVSRIDLTNAFCSATKCPAVVAGKAVYKDPGHITPETALRLTDNIALGIPAKFKKLRIQTSVAVAE